MLVLSRKPREQILLGDPANPLVVITIVAIEGGKVRLGIEAPHTTRVLRAELLEEEKDKR